MTKFIKDMISIVLIIIGIGILKDFGNLDMHDVFASVLIMIGSYIS